MGWYADRVLPRLNDLMLRGRPIEQLRQRAAMGLEGEVLEIGFGSGRNVPYYPDGVTRVRAIDPATVGRGLAAGRVARRGVPVEYLGLDGQDLPLDEASVDHVLTTWTLCTIPDADRALSEMLRVLRPGGRFHFVEHGRAPDPRVAAWQDRLTPLQRKVAGGCHLNRPIDRLIGDAGFDLVRLDNLYLRGPRFLGYMYEGVAGKP